MKLTKVGVGQLLQTRDVDGLLTRRGRLVYPLSPCLDEEARAQFGYLAQTGD